MAYDEYDDYMKKPVYYARPRDTYLNSRPRDQYLKKPLKNELSYDEYMKKYVNKDWLPYDEYLKKLRDEGQEWIPLEGYVDRGYSPEQRAKKIDEFLDSKNVQRLVHFTDKRNLLYIEKEGIQPREMLNQRKIHFHSNDNNRFDGQLGGSSVSITSINKYLLREFHIRAREEKREEREWVEIEIDRSVATSENCLFFSQNAASFKFKGIPEKALSSYEALVEMFADKYGHRKAQKRLANEPTSLQAEIIVKEVIPPSKIKIKGMIPKSQFLSLKEINV